MAETKKPTEPETPTTIAAPAPDPTANAIERLADALIARGPKSPMEVMGLSLEQQRSISLPPTPRRYRIVPGFSPDTGAKMGLVVVEEPDKVKFPHGRVVNFRGYAHPADLWVYEDQGGRLPNGFRVWQDGKPSHDTDPNCAPMGLTIQAKEWRRKNFYTRDHQAIIGRALRVAYCDDAGAGLKTPWEEALATDAAAE